MVDPGFHAMLHTHLGNSWPMVRVAAGHSKRHDGGDEVRQLVAGVAARLKCGARSSGGSWRSPASGCQTPRWCPPQLAAAGCSCGRQWRPAACRGAGRPARFEGPSGTWVILPPEFAMPMCSGGHDAGGQCGMWNLRTNAHRHVLGLPRPRNSGAALALVPLA